MIEAHGWTPLQTATEVTIPQIVALLMDPEGLPFNPTREQFHAMQRKLREKKRRKAEQQAQEERTNG